MIKYENGGIHFLLKLVQREGSVFPMAVSVGFGILFATFVSAYTLRLDHEIGSIECGKRADFAVLEDDPLEVGAEALKDVGVWGVVQGGRIFEAAAL